MIFCRIILQAISEYHVLYESVEVVCLNKCWIFVDTECFKPKILKTDQAAEFNELPDLNTKDKMTSSTPSQRYDSTEKIKSEELMNTTTKLTSSLQKNETNTNKNTQTDLLCVSFISHSSSLQGSWAMSILR